MASISDLVWKISIPPVHVEERGILYHSDFREVVADLPNESIDLIVTDPPYGINYRGCKLGAHRCDTGNSWRTASPINLIENDDYPTALNLFESLLRHSSRVLRKGGCFCACCPAGGRHLKAFTAWVRLTEEYLGVKNVVVWDKSHIGLGSHYRKAYELVLIGKKPGAPCTWNGGMTTPNIFRCKPVNRLCNTHPTP
ncbi:MAG: hypothetical protein JSV52_10765, partial [Candidatus Zixiibacteriota bacterium]